MTLSLESALQRRCAEAGPIRVAVLGAGAAGRMIVRHLAAGAPGIRLVGVASRHPHRTRDLFPQGAPAPEVVQSLGELSLALASGRPALTDDAEMLCRAEEVEVVIDATGTVEFAARMALAAIDKGKHMVLVNAELDATLGPILKRRAESRGVVWTHTDGEEPAVAMTLLRYLKSLGLKTVAAGNLKGMIDRHRTPDTQSEFARRFDQNPMKAASFADGTKLSLESAILANASGFKVARRGMHGPKCAHVRDVAEMLPAADLLAGGLVDYALGAKPYTGAFVVVHEEDAARCREMAYFKMGEGPFFVFYTPFHLPHLQVVSSVLRAVLFHDATVTPLGAPVCHVMACAKRDLKAGEMLDGVGGFLSYGLIDNAEAVSSEPGGLPIGLSEGCRLIRDVPCDEPIGMADVVFPPGRVCDRLWDDQTRAFEMGLSRA